DRVDELQGQHTLFGRVVGNTVVSSYPAKIKFIRIVDNPFDNIVTAAKKRAQHLAREAQKEQEEAARESLSFEAWGGVDSESDCSHD
ncbi:uncharacterized protein EI90DRAFT_2944171, partial [Cantharellus anzutake]|uniref:uncharacterized protein n=1 Tax=Cantharellus anzutake TaxID=1750568 RepID=UPI001904551B